MKLKDFIKTMRTETERVEFAGRCGTTYSYLKMVSYGAKPCAPRLAVAIEENTCGLVKRQELRSDWRDIWPELRATNCPVTDTAPKPHQEAA